MSTVSGMLKITEALCDFVVAMRLPEGSPREELGVALLFAASSVLGDAIGTAASAEYFYREADLLVNDEACN